VRSAVRESAWPWWLLVALYYVVCCLAHLRFSLWLVRQRETVFGSRSYSELVPLVVVLSGIALVVWVARQVRRSPRPKLTAAYWLLWLASVAAIDLLLTYSINEYAHYPQYGMLAWLLARALDARRTRWCVGRVLFWATLLGTGDELLQYLWITTTYSDYLDFNDILVNLVAAAAGLLLYYGAAELPPQDSNGALPGLEWASAAVLVIAMTACMQTGLVIRDPPGAIPPGGLARQPDGSGHLYLQRGPSFYGSWQKGPRHGKHYVLTPEAGMGWTLAAFIAFAAFGRTGGRRRNTPFADWLARRTLAK